MLDKKIVTLTALCRPLPAAFRTASRFLNAFTARSYVPPGTNWLVSGSMPSEPEVNTSPPEIMAWDRRGPGFGAWLVMTAVREDISMVDSGGKGEVVDCTILAVFLQY